MKRFAVAYMNFFDHDLQVEIVDIDTDKLFSEAWLFALDLAFPGKAEYVKGYNTLERAREEAFNQDWLFNVVEIFSRINATHKAKL